MSDETPKSVWSGTFRVFDLDIRCHVLDNGQRIIEEQSMVDLLTAMESPDHIELGDISKFAHWMNGNKTQ